MNAWGLELTKKEKQKLMVFMSFGIKKKLKKEIKKRKEKGSGT